MGILTPDGYVENSETDKSIVKKELIVNENYSKQFYLFIIFGTLIIVILGVGVIWGNITFGKIAKLDLGLEAPITNNIDVQSPEVPIQNTYQQDTTNNININLSINEEITQAIAEELADEILDILNNETG